MTDLAALCADRPLRRVASGDTLIDAGQPPGAVYVLRSGAVTIERDGDAFARVDHRGAMFGELSVVLDAPATATVRASTDVEVWVVDDPEDFFRTRPGAAYEVLRMTAARLDGLTHYLVDVKRQFADQTGHVGMVADILDLLVHHQAPPGRPGSVRDPDPHTD